MTGAATAGAGTLPAAVAELVASFERAHTGSTLLLWQAVGSGWRCVYPSGREGVAGAPGTPASRIRVPGSEPVLELEAAGAPLAPDALSFLAQALSRFVSYEREASSAARELTERYEEINLLYSISEILGSVLSLEAAAEHILGEVADVMGARRASLWVYDAAERVLVLTAAVGAEGLVGPIRLDDTRSVTARVFRERQPLNVERGVELPRGSRVEPPARRREAFLSVPMNYTPPGGEPRTVGVITLVGGRAGEPFSAGDTRLLTAVASQVGAALETQRLVRESLRRERLVRELELAHDLQLKLLPDAADFAGAGEVAVRCVPADSVGGDFYYLSRLSGGRLGVTIGDISGHGFSAALMMALTISAVAIYAREAASPGEVLRHVHRALIDELESTEMYLTLYYGVLDPAAGRLVYSNAGHPHAFQVTASGAPTRLGATAPPLGTLPGEQHAEAVVPWRAGADLLCLFTDGLSDAFAGEARLLAEVVRLRSEPPERILDQLFNGPEPGAGAAVPPDDRTAVLVRV